MISLFEAVAGCIFDFATFNTHVPVNGSSCAATVCSAIGARQSTTSSEARDGLAIVLLPPRLGKREVGVRPPLLRIDRARQLLAVAPNLAFLRDHDDELHQEAVRRTHFAVVAGQEPTPRGL